MNSGILKAKRRLLVYSKEKYTDIIEIWKMWGNAWTWSTYSNLITSFFIVIANRRIFTESNKPELKFYTLFSIIIILDILFVNISVYFETI